MKKVLVVCLVAMMMLGLGCAAKSADPLRVAALKGPTGAGLAYLSDSDGYALEIYDAPDVASAKFISGEVDVACVPVNLASVLYNKLEGDVVLLNVNTLGVLYILDNSNSVQSVQDLAGKTIYASGQGSTPEYILNYILAQNGLTDQVTVSYVGEHAALAAMVAAGEVEIAMLPEPNVSAVRAKNADVRVALDLTAEWNAVSDTPLAQGCTVARRAFYEANKQRVNSLLKDYAASVEKVNGDEGAADKLAALEILPSAALAKSAIPQCNIVCITGEEAKATMQDMLQTLFDANPASVGGALPAEDFYAAG
jgi:NitT/TauT family transport system substrate-binding protein